jgi:hypothetical protein
MRAIIVNLGRTLGVALGAVLVTAAPGQQPTAPLPAPIIRPPIVTPAPERGVRPAAAEAGNAYKMEIFEGPNRTVRYFAPGSPGEQAQLMDLERSENEVAYLRDLQALRRQYVTSERTLEPMRRYVQEELYGTSISTGWYNTQGGVYGPGYGYGYGGYGYPYINAYSSTAYGYAGGVTGYLGGSMTSITRNLGLGMGDEGKLKDAMVQVIAGQAASPDYQAAVLRGYSTALANVASNDRLAKGLGLERGKIAEAAGTPDKNAVQATLTLKDGKTVEGKMTEDGEWYVVDTGKAVERVRKSEVTRITQPK